MNTLARPKPIHVGKVRETYDLGGNRLLIVATDRVSTFDVVHPTPIPGKGEILTKMSAFWFTNVLREVVANHFITTDLRSLPTWAQQFQGCAMVVEKLKMLPVEAIVRGYITGTGWKDYQQTSKISGIKVPAGMIESEQFLEPLFTPSTKAQKGHDENVDFAGMVQLLGGDRDLAMQVRETSLAIYNMAHQFLRERGIILADTKFEFGLRQDGTLVLGDEVLTPDSSRFWPLDGYQPGGPQPSFDKQFVRDWAKETGWNGQPPAPAIPDVIVCGTQGRYAEASMRVMS